MDYEYRANISDFVVDSKTDLILAVGDGYRETSFGSVLAHYWRSMEELTAGMCKYWNILGSELYIV